MVASGFWMVLLVAFATGLRVGELPSAIEGILRQPQFDRMEWGILVERELPNGTYGPIYARNSRQLFTPASNNKVLTTAPAYLFLGDAFRITTPFLVAQPSNVRGRLSLLRP